MAKLFDDWNGKIELGIIPHDQQRYDTVGDWNFTYYPNEEGATLSIAISETDDKRMNFCLFMHELNEALLFMFKNGFTQESAKIVDKWDLAFIQTSGAEPGASNLAPYFAEHMFATAIEHLVAAQVDLDWNLYSDTISCLVKG